MRRLCARMGTFCIGLGLLVGGARAEAPSDTIYDLHANLPLAHVVRAGVVADAGSVGFVKYVRGNMGGSWTLNATEQGAPVALVPGVQANLWLPVDADLARQKLELEARFLPFGKKQFMDPFIDGKKIGNLVLKPGWQTIRVPIPPNRVSAGLVHVKLHFRRSVAHNGVKTAAALRFVRLVPAGTSAAPESESELRSWLAGGADEQLLLPSGAGLDFYIVPPNGARLGGNATGGTVGAWAQVDGQQPRKLGGGQSLDISLDRFANQPVRLMLRGMDNDVRLAGAVLAGGRLGRAQPKKPRFIVFWLIDTLRADKLEFYTIPNSNNRKVKTPNLTALAADATRFELFYVQGSESKASHASLFTGVYPFNHRVFTHEAKLPDKLLTLAEAAAARGYKTAGFVSNGYISKRWNYAQGFQHFRNFIRESKPNSAKWVAKYAVEWMAKNAEQPFYLYLGTSDPHVTYRAHKNYIGQYDRGEYKGRYKKAISGKALGRIKSKKRPPSERDQRRIEALYDNEIAFNDEHFGRVIEQLKALGIYDETMIIVTGDHGDEFWEHGSCGHGHSLHQELVRVPLIVRYPGVFPAGKVVESGADGVDLLPTLGRLIGHPMPESVQGMDLLPYVGAEGAVYPAATIASQGRGRYALQVGPAKAIMGSPYSVRIYDTARDPAERKNQMGQRAILTLTALDPLSLFVSRVKRWNKQAWGPANNLRPEFGSAAARRR